MRTRERVAGVSVPVNEPLFARLGERNSLTGMQITLVQSLLALDLEAKHASVALSEDKKSG